WNGQPDGLACSISHFMKFIDNPKKLNLIIDIDQRVANTSDMIDSLLLLAECGMDVIYAPHTLT
ncbi:TPA: hypothetical protein ACHK0F_005327, partial [Escherichia coli]